MSEEALRAFLALEITETVRSHLAAARGELRHELPRARWTRPEGWHLTLKFLGEVDRGTLDELSAALAPRLRGLIPVTVELGNAGFFPTPSRPRVAWIGGTAEGAEKVVAVVEEIAEETGFPRQRRQWSVHLTMARLKAPWTRAAVDRFLEWGEQLALDAFTCREAVVFESVLQPGGAVYTALERLPFE